MLTDRKQTEEIEMPTYRANAIAVGVLFIACSAASILSVVPLGAPVEAPVDFARLAASGNQVIMTALIEFIWALTGAGIAIGLYPVLRRHNRALALGSVAGRLFENVLIVVATLSLLVLLTVSQQAAGSAAPAAFQVTGDALVAMRTWTHGFVATIPFAIATLLYSYVLYRSRLVPRWLAGWGFVAGALSLVASVNAGFTQEFGFTTATIVLSVPIALQEMVLAVWLIVKGFDRSALTSRAGGKNSLPAAVISTEFDRSALTSGARSQA